MTNEFATIPLSPYISAQGVVIDRKTDGRGTIDTGTDQVTGRSIRKIVATMVATPATCEAIDQEAPEPEYV